jgi:hypothetical protein
MRKMQIEKCVPIGSYTALFTGVEDTDHKEYGPGLAWHFEIFGGPLNGRKIGRITSRLPTTKNSCGRLLRGLAGNIDGEVDIDSFRGTRVRIVVGETSTGGTRVDSVAPDLSGERPLPTQDCPF